MAFNKIQTIYIIWESCFYGIILEVKEKKLLFLIK